MTSAAPTIAFCFADRVHLEFWSALVQNTRTADGAAPGALPQKPPLVFVSIRLGVQEHSLQGTGINTNPERLESQRMGRFFRENIIGILLISFLGSVLASIVLSYLGPQEPKSANALVDLMKQPVPALALLPYSLAILLAFAAYAYWQNKKHGRELVRLKTEGDREAADLRTEKETLSARIQELEHHTSGTGTLMRRIALVLADPASPFQDSTLETVLKRVVSMEGNIATEREVADAMGIMLEAKAIYKSGTKFELTNDWRARLRELRFQV